GVRRRPADGVRSPPRARPRRRPVLGRGPDHRAARPRAGYDHAPCRRPEDRSGGGRGRRARGQGASKPAARRRDRGPPPRSPAPGRRGGALRLRFAAPLNQPLRGFYSAQADGRRYAFTQCEAADARRVLPCFDEPSFKARFRVAVTLPNGHAAVSNSPVEREEPVSGRGSKRIIRFARTPPLSTYL